MKLTVSLFALLLLVSCKMDRKNSDRGQNQFSSKDLAIASVVQSLPQLLNSNQKKLYNLTDAELKSLTPGKEVAVRHVSFDDIMNAGEGDLANLLTRNPSSALIPLATNNVSRIFIGVKNDKDAWRIESVGNRKFLDALKDPQTAGDSEVVSIEGLAIDLLKRADASGVVYVPVETNEKAGFTKDTPYSEAVTMQNLKTYAATLSRQFGDKLKKGEIDN